MDFESILINCLELITISIPPYLPIALTIGVGNFSIYFLIFLL